VVALVIATVLAYAPALSAPFVMDDENAIPESSAIQWRAPAGSAVAGRPLVSATLALNHAVNAWLGVDQRRDPDGPYKAIGYRLLNVLAHLCTGALLFGVLRRTIRGRAIPEDWRALADPLAGAVCAIWLLHPIQSEAINYLVQRTELLASLFYVAALYASIRAWDASFARARLGWYAVGVLAGVFGMLCKEIVISAPLAIVLYDRAFRVPSWSALRRPGQGRGWFYVALAAACMLPYVVISAGARGDTAGFESPMKWYVYFYSQCWAIAHYLRLAVWPNALTVDYGEQAIGGTRGIPGLVMLTVLGVAIVAAWTRVPRWGWFAFLGSWFFMLLAPSSSFVPIPTEIAAERRIYLALAAVVVLAVVGAEWSRRRFVLSMSSRQLSYGFMGVAAVLAGVTAARSHTYSSSEQLWRGVVSNVPGNLRGYVNLGSALFREQPPKYAEAETLFNHAIVRDTTCRSGCAQLAYVMSAQGRLPEAAGLLERTIAHDPGNGPVERRLALILMKLGSFDRAVPHLEHVASLYPTEQHLVVLAVAYFVLQRQQDGIAEFQRALQRYPDNAEVRKLGNTLYTFGRSDDAVPHLKELAIALAKDWR
jgi:tetratricopeptide (TPR) repeat protein